MSFNNVIGAIFPPFWKNLNYGRFFRELELLQAVTDQSLGLFRTYEEEALALSFFLYVELNEEQKTWFFDLETSIKRSVANDGGSAIHDNANIELGLNDIPHMADNDSKEVAESLINVVIFFESNCCWQRPR